MNAQLAQQMQSAYEVSTQAWPHFLEAATLQEEADLSAAKAYKTRMWLYVAATILIGAIPMVGGFLLMPAGIFLFLDYRGRFHDEVEAARQEGYARAEEARAEGAAILNGNEEAMAGLYGEYCTPDATEYLMNITAAGRADTLAEALLMCDEQMHRWKIEEANAAVVAAQQEQSASLKGIRRSNAVSAVANVTNAIFNIANSI